MELEPKLQDLLTKLLESKRIEMQLKSLALMQELMTYHSNLPLYIIKSTQSELKLVLNKQELLVMKENYKLLPDKMMTKEIKSQMIKLN